MSTNTERFLDEYKRLEEVAIKQYHFPADGTAIAKLEQEPAFRNIKAELSYCREVRNLLQHKPKIQGSYAVEPSDDMIKMLSETVQKVNNPPRARNVAIPLHMILSKGMEDLVLPTMREMMEKMYTHVPIMKNGSVIGVFSENTIFSYLATEGIVEIEENMKFSELEEYLPIEKHISESFRFIKQDMLLANVKEIFEEAHKKQDRIGLIFTTQTGRKTEKLLGIITAWDVAGRD